MGLSIDQVHKMRKDKLSQRMILTGKNPYVRWISEGNFPVNCQNGRFYTDGGDPIAIADVPSWVWNEARKMNEEGRKNVGLVLPEEGAEDKPEPKEEPPQVRIEDEPIRTLVDEVYELKAGEDSHWTKKGLPDLNTLKEKMGRYVSRGEVEEAAPGYKRPS
jgi:hypothetical protein|tara:strand:+ start:3883 stop:4365 length:483 start_codon:yes stop_codon:yes gene_type:complete